MTIGVLAVQGAFIEHEQMLEKLGIPCIEIRKKDDLSGIDGIILPGGESTVQGQLLEKLDMKEPLRAMIKNGLPVLATCAGLILLAENIGEKEAPHLGTMPVKVRRNAYGRQLSSFMTTADVKGIGDYPMVFIRAPYITDVAATANSVNDCKSVPSSVTNAEPKNQTHDVMILSEVDGHIVAAQYQNQIGLAFHPEMTDDTRIHQYFIDLVRMRC
ncbi:pyridoxal 5'-phosphate synthase glutaminase subunit PdxT [Eubacterium ramulus]